jgi:hypothetical protein
VTWADSIKAVLWIVSIGALLFLSAGTLDWRGAWIFMAEFVIGGLAVTRWLAWRDPGLLKERMGGPFQKGQAFWGQGVHGIYHRRLVWQQREQYCSHAGFCFQPIYGR